MSSDLMSSDIMSSDLMCSDIMSSDTNEFRYNEFRFRILYLLFHDHFLSHTSVWLKEEWNLVGLRGIILQDKSKQFLYWYIHIQMVILADCS